LIDNKLKDIKRIIIEELEKENIKVHKIILFGSRARGDFKEDSDWDVLIIVEDDIERKKKFLLISNLRKKLAKKLLDVDLIIKNKSELGFYEDFYGSVIFEALKEGIEL
jgi:predicted nucleotidyltransferase